MINCSFDMVSANNSVAVAAYRADRDGAFLEMENVTFTCPSGYTGL